MNPRLRVLGGVSLTRGEQPLAGRAAQRRNLALLAVLAVHTERAGGITREKVATLLWPDADEVSAGNNLKQALHVLRRELGAAAVVGTTILQLGADIVTTDVVEFERAIGKGDLEAAVECYGGVLLDGFHPGDPADEYEPWVDAHRSRLARLHREALESLASRATAAGDHRLSLRWWRRLADVDPLDGVSAANLISALRHSGDQAGALRAYQAHQASLARDGMPVSPVVDRALAEPLPVLEERVLPRGPSAVDAGATPSESSSTPRFDGAPRASPSRRRPAVAAIAVGIFAVAVTLVALAAARRPDPDRLAVAAVVGTDAASNERIHQLANAIARRLSEAGIATPSVIDSGQGRRTPAPRGPAVLELVVSRGPPPDNTYEVTLIDTRSAAQLWSGQSSDANAASSGSLVERAAAATAARLDRRMKNWIHVASGPATVESYLEFRDGLDLYGSIQPKEAEQRFRRAAAADPGFTMARIMTAWASLYAHNGEAPALAIAISDSITNLQLPPLDRAMVEHQAAVFRNDYAAAYERAQRVVAVAPQAEWRYLLAESALLAGRGHEAVRVLSNLDPETGWLQGSLVYWIAFQRALHLIGDHVRELDVLERAQKRMPTRDLTQLKVAALAAAGRLKEVQREIDRSQSAVGSYDPSRTLTMYRALIEFRAHGYVREAAQIAAKGLNYLDHLPAARQQEEVLTRVDMLIGAGRLADARQQLSRMSADTADPYTLAVRAVVAADLKDRVTARAIAATLSRLAGADSVPDVVISRAQVAVGLGDREEAVRLLRVAYRRGFSWRFQTHLIWPFDRLRGWAPYDELAGSVD